MLALFIVVGILLAIVLMLSVPVDLVFSLSTIQERRSELKVGWLFGIVWKKLLPGKDRTKKKKIKKPKKRKRSVRQNITSLMSVARARGIAGGIIRLVRRVVGGIRVRQLDADIRLGFDSPVDTGMIYALIWPLFIKSRLGRTARIGIMPVFTGPAFEATLQGDIRIFPAEMLANFLRFVFSPAGFRFLKLMVALRWKRKK